MAKFTTIKNFRWWIVGLIALATAINYLDRQNLPVALSEIRKSFEISDVDYGLINSLFLFAYGTMYAVGGRVIDVLGSKIGYFVLIVWWSIANMIHGLVSSVTGLGIARFLLGIGEGGAFPGSAKVVSEWFSKKERALAFGIFNTGSSVGAVIAPPLIALIIATWSWRWTFLIFGTVGLIWATVWLLVYAVPARSRWVSDEERLLIKRSQEEEQAASPSSTQKIPWLSLFKYRKLWGLLAIKFLPDAGWYFFIFWLPKYLNDIRGLDIKEIGTYAWIPYAMAGIGSLSGGWFSSFLQKKNLSLDLSRKIPLGIAAALLPASLFITDVSLHIAVFFFGMAMFGHQLYSTIVQTLVADMFPSSVVGSVSGLMGCAATYGAMLFSLVVGFIIEGYGYELAFMIAGLLHPLSFLLLFVIIKRVEMVKVSVSAPTVT